MELAPRIAHITPSLTLSIDSKAKALRAQGVDVCSFAAGEPDFDTPEHIKAAAIKALENNFTRYTPVAGIPELREAIAHKFLTENQLDYQPQEIIVSNGAKQSCFNAIMACVGEGDEVIIPAPYWISYPEMVRLAGAEPIIIPTTAANNWKITAEDFANAMSPRTKMIIINSPGNPTGAVYTKEELRAIAEVAADEEILILSDEIYESLIYDELKHVSIASVTPEARDLTITINGFSKAYAMTGWRLGYLGAPKKIAQAIEALQSHSSSNACSFAQYGAVAALNSSQQCVTDMREEFNIRREYMYDRLSKMHQLSAIKPSGAFYMLTDISKFGMSSMNFADRLLSKSNVAVIPGIAFGNDKTIRMSYATGMDIIKEGLDRLEDFCKTL
ncbi:MAG: pyridoxal phosphate-dependent aminotransferase [Verrucomicrobiae bacterium]|jgi:aspartate aminotransferase|nr:pyridoxal phosphate-dependent aminotransferase [Verrucomicrobiae bacterium]